MTNYGDKIQKGNINKKNKKMKIETKKIKTFECYLQAKRGPQTDKAPNSQHRRN